MKKILSIILIVTIFLIPVSNMNAQEISKDIKITNVVKNDKKYSQITECNGIKYYFEDTKEYTLTVTHIKNNNFLVYYKDKILNTMNKKEIKINPLNDNVFNKISDDIKQNTIKLEFIENLAKTNSNKKEKIFNKNILKSISEDDKYKDYVKIYNIMKEDFGEPFKQTYSKSLNYRGYTAKLYRTKSFIIYPEDFMQKLFRRKTLVSIISAYFSVPIDTVSKAITTILEHGMLVIDKDVTPSTFTADVNWSKEINVGKYWPYRADKMDKGRAFVGDRRAIRMHKSYWENRDYSDDNSLMKTGIDNYIRIFRGN